MKRKFLIRFAIIFSVVWIVILTATYYASSKYRDYAIAYLKKYLDEQLRTEIQIRKDDIHFTLLKKFPYASIDLYNILVKSASGPNYAQIDYTSKDTLLYAQKLSLVFNLWNIFNQKYELKKIETEDALLNILFDANGKGNFLIFKENETADSKDSFKLDLKKIQLKNVILTYVDAGNREKFTGNVTEGTISGRIVDEDFNLKTSLKAERCQFFYETTEYLRNHDLEIKALIEKKHSTYSITEGQISVYGFKLNAEVNYEIDKHTYELRLSGHSIPLTKLREPIFDVYLKDSKLLPQRGNLDLKTSISGIAGHNPYITILFKIQKGVLIYDNQQTIQNIFLVGSYTNGENRAMASSQFVADSLSFSSGQGDISVKIKVENFNSPKIDGKLNGTIDLASLPESMAGGESFNLSGLVRTQITFSGIAPKTENFKISDLNALTMNGWFQTDDLKVETPDNSLAPVLGKGEVTFTNLREFTFQKFNVEIGKSAIELDGVISDLPLFSGTPALLPFYRFSVTSSDFHVEDFLVRETGGPKKNEGKQLKLPDSVLFYANFSALNFHFGKFDATDVKASLQYNPHTLQLNSFSMKSQGGTLQSNIDIVQQTDGFLTICKATLHSMDIKGLFDAFNNFGQTIIVSDNLGGKISGDVQVSVPWNFFLEPRYNQLSLQSDIIIDEGKIVNYEPLMGLSDFIEVKELKDIHFDQLRSTILINHGTVYIQETDIHSSAIDIRASGEHLFDNSYTYRVQLQLADILWKKAKKKPQNTEFGYEVDDGLGRTTLPLLIKGKGTEYDVSYDKRKAGNLFREKLKNEKSVLKELFSSPENTPAIEDKNSSPIEWEEDQKPVNKTTDAPKKKEEKEKNEFSVEWEDN